MKGILVGLLVLSTLAMAAPEVTVGLPAIAYLAKNIGGPSLKVTTLVSSQQDPHDFAATPSLLQEIKSSRLFFSCHLKFEQVIEKRLSQNYKKLKFVDLSKAVPSQQVSEDPHIWLSVTNLSKMAKVIKDELVMTFPEYKAIYLKNYKKLSEFLGAVDQDFSRKLSSHHGDTFFVHHPAFGYFAREYGLRQEAIENQGKNPSPKQLMGLIHLAKERKVRLIILQPQFNQRPAKMLATHIDGTVFSANPMDADPVALLARVVDAIVKYYPVTTK
jgi:zinc transport system substrate-binding protein